MGRLSKAVKHKRSVLHRMIDEGRLDGCLGLCYPKDRKMKLDDEMLMIVLTAINIKSAVEEATDIDKPMSKEDFEASTEYSVDVDNIQRFIF